MSKLSKRDQILSTAGKLFIEKGFQAVSMDQMAAAVPVSKPTLYAHFSDKRALFQAVVALRCEKVLATLKEGIEKDVSLEEGLRSFGHQFLDLLLSDSSLQFHRVIVAECASFPDMAKMFYETGPGQMQELLKNFLSTSRKPKDIFIQDPSLSADIFLGMIKGRGHMKCLLGVNEPRLSKKERQKLVDAAVGIFLNGHRA